MNCLVADNIILHVVHYQFVKYLSSTDQTSYQAIEIECSNKVKTSLIFCTTLTSYLTKTLACQIGHYSSSALHLINSLKPQMNFKTRDPGVTSLTEYKHWP